MTCPLSYALLLQHRSCCKCSRIDSFEVFPKPWKWSSHALRKPDTHDFERILGSSFCGFIFWNVDRTWHTEPCQLGSSSPRFYRMWRGPPIFFLGRHPCWCSWGKAKSPSQPVGALLATWQYVTGNQTSVTTHRHQAQRTNDSYRQEKQRLEGLCRGVHRPRWFRSPPRVSRAWL